MGQEEENRKQAEEDAQEDLELRDDDADKIAGGTTKDPGWDVPPGPLK